jgi:hypothetical protein
MGEALSGFDPLVAEWFAGRSARAMLGTPGTVG